MRYFGTFSAFWDSYKYKNLDKITQILENVVRCKYFEAGGHIENPIKNSYQDCLGRTTQTLDHVVVVHTLIRDKRKSQINEYSDMGTKYVTQNPFSWALCGYIRTTPKDSREKIFYNMICGQ